MATDLSKLTIIDALGDPRLIGDDVSPAQETALRALYGLPLSGDQLGIFARATGREDYVPREFREATFIAGRRSGKSSKLGSNVAIFEACFRAHELARGERAYVVALAPTKKQSAIVFEYILARLEGSPVLRKLIVGEPRADEVDLANGTTIGVWPCNYRSIRGISIVCAVCDEVAFWFDDASGANPASEVMRAIRPAMASFKNAKLLKNTSPHAKIGVAWEDWNSRASHPELLAWKLDSATMNPSLDAEFLAAEEARDPESFAREYGADFYESASAFLPTESVQACVKVGRYELLPQEGVRYVASLDAAFRSDAFSFTIAHRADDVVVEDFTRSWRGSRSKPVSLSGVLTEIVATLKRFGVWKIHGDQFCAEPIRQALKEQGVEFMQTTTLGARASQIWGTLRTLVTSGKIEMLDNAETSGELKRLELIVTGGGGQRVEASTGHDDRAVTLAVAAHEAIARSRRTEPFLEVLELRPDVPQNTSGDGDHDRWFRPIF